MLHTLLNNKKHNSRHKLRPKLNKPRIISMLLLGVAGTFLGARFAVDSTAVRRGRYELALGNVLGSNLTNLTLIFGSLLIASPLTVNLTAFSIEVTFILISSITIWYFLASPNVKV